MKPGTRVYWNYIDPKEHYLWKYQSGKKPEVIKRTGTILNMDSNFICLVARESDGRVVKMKATDLYVVSREIAL